MKYSLLLLISLYLTIGCSPDEREQAQQDQRQQQLQAQLIESTPEFDRQLAEVLESYFNLKDALVATEPILASEKADSLLQLIQRVKPTGLSQETQTIWETYAGNIIEEGSRIVSEDDVEKQRVYFEPLSEAMIDLIKTFRPVGYTVYHQSCPMVRGGSADWLSREEQIANPYHGDRMMRCGEIIERI